MTKALFFDEDLDWDDPPRLAILRWKCWIIGHRPEPFHLVNPKSGHSTPVVWCWRCGKDLPLQPEPVVTAPVALPRRQTAVLDTPAPRVALPAQPLALPAAQPVGEDLRQALRKEMAR